MSADRFFYIDDPIPSQYLPSNEFESTSGHGWKNKADFYCLLSFFLYWKNSPVYFHSNIHAILEPHELPGFHRCVWSRRSQWSIRESCACQSDKEKKGNSLSTLWHMHVTKCSVCFRFDINQKDFDRPVFPDPDRFLAWISYFRRTFAPFFFFVLVVLITRQLGSVVKMTEYRDDIVFVYVPP